MTRTKTLILLLAAVLAIGLGTQAAAQDPDPAPTGWQKTADLALALNQTSYNNAWAGSEVGAITWTFNGNLEAQKALSAKLHWKNTLKLTFGQQHTQARLSANERRWLSPEKASDRIFFETLMLATMDWVVEPYAAVVFESQFYDPVQEAEIPAGVDLPSGVAAGEIENAVRFLHPILLTESVGLGHKFIAQESGELFSRVGFAVRQHIARSVIGLNDTDTAYEFESTTLTDGGLEWVTDYSRTFGGGDLKYVTKLRVFQALFNSESDELEKIAQDLGDPDLVAEADDWKTADVAWENTFSASVAKYIQVSLFAELLYDKEVNARGRFREILGLGVSYKLF